MILPLLRSGGPGPGTYTIDGLVQMKPSGIMSHGNNILVTQRKVRRHFNEPEKYRERERDAISLKLYLQGSLPYQTKNP